MAKTDYKTEFISLSLLEANDLIRRLEEQLGVSAGAAVAANPGWWLPVDLGLRNKPVDQSTVAVVISAVIARLLAAIELAGKLAPLQTEAEQNMQDETDTEDEDPVLLAMLPVFRELVRNEKVEPPSDVPTESRARLTAIAQRARAALEKREHTPS